MKGPVGIQWFFAAVALVNVVMVIFFLPETRGKSLHEIEEHYQFNTMWLGRVKSPEEGSGVAGREDAETGLPGTNVYIINTVTASDMDGRKSSTESVAEMSVGDSYKL